MPRNTKPREIDTYVHSDKKRANNPPVGLVTPDTDKDSERKTYAFDPHLDPQLVWAGKAEHTSFEVPTVSLHVHERIDPRSIIDTVRNSPDEEAMIQPSLFEQPTENLPIRQAIEFYKHKHGWSNRLVAGDSLLVMNSLLEKEGLGGQVQLVYIDPPYGITYGSNFQPFTDNRAVKDGNDAHLTAEPEQIRAFRDTWELGIHSYLTYLRDRLLLSRELLTDSGCVFVQISDENAHRVRLLLDELFGAENFVTQISTRTSVPLGAKYIPEILTYIIIYAKDKDKLKFRKLFTNRDIREETRYSFVEFSNGEWRRLTSDERHNLDAFPPDTRFFVSENLNSAGRTESCVFPFEFEGKTYNPTQGKSWKTNRTGMEKLVAAARLVAPANNLTYRLYLDDYPVRELTNLWSDTQGASNKAYVVQTAEKIIQRCILMSTDPGDLIFDPTCGSGTTAYIAEQWGRRWITCDTSRVAIALAKQRLMTATFDYYELAHPNEGVGSGFAYRTVPHVTLKSVANNPEIEPGMSREQVSNVIARYAPQETLYDQPKIDRKRMRVSGPFTVEAVPSPSVKSLDEVAISNDAPADASVVRSGESLRQSEWRDELLKTGIRGKGGQFIEFTRVEPLAGTRWLHADAETNDEVPQRVVLSFGPEHAPLEQRQVELAIEEAQILVPRPKMIVFAAFQFDPEAAKDIDETNWPGVTLLKAQMNADLLTEDLKKKRASNESFWLIGQPDVELEVIKSGEDKGKYRVSVHGFDYYNTRTGTIESGGSEKI